MCKSQWCDLSGGGVRTARNKEQGCYSVTELLSDSGLMTAKVLKPDFGSGVKTCLCNSQQVSGTLNYTAGAIG